MNAIVLLGHGARDPAWRMPLERLREAVSRHVPGSEIHLAFLEFMAPALPEVLESLARRQVLQVRVVPVFLAQGGHVKRDVPKIIEEVSRHHPHMKIEQSVALGEMPAVIEAMALEIVRQD